MATRPKPEKQGSTTPAIPLALEYCDLQKIFSEDF